MRSNPCYVWVETRVVIIVAVCLRSYARCVKFKCMLCLLSNSCCVWVQIHVVWDQNHIVFWFTFMLLEFKYMLCLHQVHIVLAFKFILCLSSVMGCVNAICICIWVQNLIHIWINFIVVFELKFMLCLNTIVYCIIQWMFVIVHLVRMAERAQYLDVVTRVPVGMDSLGISVKVHLIFISLCVLSVTKT